MSTVIEPTTTEVASPLSITDAAAEEVRTLIAQQDRDDLYLRVYVSGGGCSGLQYGMALDENVEPGDEVFDLSGIRLVVDNTSLRYMSGSVVDYITTDMGGGFKIENPNATKSCGCGSSFSTGDEEAAGLDTKAGGGCGSCGCH
ncbi:iron-sulfur cluster insertion protein ErpA [Capsulimonas corticalis]|uniref:Iron-sulfur cluster insertion protein ErpA n=1 Tax=Capsulimonas corticalis TaxID=2219043 RepID=A0A402CYA2_9BACT|nr:iron-sulfur cluster insertion protein ErpA [Capsulimonas corticalis]BDI31398.1 iron-sulfur cluster insertion protein ErpA [Capsulimonas corticalis]